MNSVQLSGRIMKKTLCAVIIFSMLLVACKSASNDDEDVKPIETFNEKVDLKYKTIEEDSEELEEGKREVVTEGKDGYKVVVYEKGTDRYLNEWVYEEPIHEVVKVGSKKEVADEPIDSQTSGSGGGTTAGGSTSGGSTNTGGGYTPPATGGTTQPPTNNGGGSTGGGGTTQPPTEPPYPVNGLGNSGLLFDTEAEAWNEFYRILESEELSKQYGTQIGITTNDGYVVGGSVTGVRMSDGSIKYSIHFK